ncbi:hypothetical protein EW093_07570 [Thiospirochaeta perfilievii]|uniref:Lipocalin-like domain-containing protein n=1 Tax=Thiospirochaeta perfilievii TaxID=252967 RepID=A0A5C1QD52_9SPIO|nr:hypothetical protein [Thiospirochaeta perfilievii]QEN04566.1 hypothetical protein EW093_07570 [Thiospirochaeta perfilievii]
MKKILFILFPLLFFGCDNSTNPTSLTVDETVNISTSTKGHEVSYNNGNTQSTFVIDCQKIDQVTNYTNIGFYYSSSDMIPKNGTYNIVSSYSMSTESEASFSGWNVGDNSYSASTGTLTISNANTTTNSYDIEINATGYKLEQNENNVFVQIKNYSVAFEGKASITYYNP